MTHAVRFSVVIPAHNAARSIEATIRALLAITRQGALETIIVDDASTDDTAAVASKFTDDGVVLVRHETNRGRGASRNTGALAAHGTHLLFIDVDSIPVDTHFLFAYERAIASSANLIFGAYTSARSDFWSRYEAASLQRSFARFRDGMHYSMSSRNFVIERSLFMVCGGFSERYRHYGFEDRDLFIRALTAGARPALAQGAVVRHAGDVTLPIVMHKMREAGRENARIFRNDHPDAYSRLGYRSIDASRHPLLAVIASPAAALMTLASYKLENLLQSKYVPFRARATIARVGSALSYLEGTRIPKSNSTSD
jgi:glycosyltransferase involved in cell wall biosynthesis